MNHYHSYVNSTVQIKEAKYEQVTPQQVADNSTHLHPDQKDSLIKLLRKFSHLFSGKLGRYNHAEFTLELQESNTSPIFCKPYPVAQVHTAVFKKKLQHLISEQVLEQVQTSQWAFLTFIIPKRDGRVCWVSDFRKLNAILKRSRYFLPSISEIMQRCQGFTYITKVDISMGFYTFKLDEASQRLCVISTPFGLFKYKRLPMGINNSPDFFQSIMHPLFADLPHVECFIDDIGIFSNSTFHDHLRDLQEVLLRLERNGFTVNPLKGDWATKSTEYLGFLLSPEGIKSMPYKITTITNISGPTSTKHVCVFVGLVNYYKDM